MRVTPRDIYLPFLSSYIFQITLLILIVNIFIIIYNNILYGGVGIYFNKDIQNLEILDISIENEMKSLFARFDYGGETYTVGGIYRHPNGNTRHFVEDLEGALDKLGPNTTSI